MKIVVSSDWHLRTTPTKFRKSNYYQLMLNKLDWIVNLTNKLGVLVLIQPGDFFDIPEIPSRVQVDIIKILNDCYGDIFTVYGQHDLLYRRREDTTLSVFIESGVVDLLNESPIGYNDSVTTEDDIPVNIYGASFNEPVPEVQNKNNFNILAIHKMITKDGPLFPDQENYISSRDFSNTYKDYNLVVSGDNHNSFSYISDKGPSIINCGSLMRMTTAQYKHKPCVWVIDTNTGELEQHFIPILPPEEVFKEEAQELKEKDEKIEAFIKVLKNSKNKQDKKLSFEDNVEQLFKENKNTKDVEELAMKFITKFHTKGK